MSKFSRTIEATPPAIFGRLGIRPVINACGVYTDLGGSILSPAVWTAMEEVNRSYVRMVDLLKTTGRHIAEMVGAESARVTPGASSAIALGTAACMTGMDGAAWERLPDTTGLTKVEVVIQHNHRFKYDRCARMTGARLVAAGDKNGTSADQLRRVIGPQTAMLLFPAHLDGKGNTLGLKKTLEVTREHGVPTFADAAYVNYPTSLLGSFTAAGADLACFSAKYFGGPNGGGFLCGRQELMDAVAGVDFTEFESGLYRTFGRAFKMDRQIVVGTVVALEEWLAMDHEARWASYARRVDRMLEKLHGLSGIEARPKYFTMDECLLDEPVNCAAVRFTSSGRSAQQVSDALAAGDLSIATVVFGDTLVAAVDCIVDGQETTIGERLREELSR